MKKLISFLVASVFFSHTIFAIPSWTQKKFYSKQGKHYAVGVSNWEDSKFDAESAANLDALRKVATSKNSQVRSEYQQRMKDSKIEFYEDIQITTNASYADTIIEDIFYEERDDKYRAYIKVQFRPMTKEEKDHILNDRIAIYVEKANRELQKQKANRDAAQAQRDLARQRQTQAQRELHQANQELLLAKQEKSQALTYLAKANATEKRLESIEKVSNQKTEKMKRIRSGKLTTSEKIEVGIEETLFDDDGSPKNGLALGALIFLLALPFGLLIL